MLQDERDPSIEYFPLSEAQLSVWLVQMLDRDDPCYNIAESIEILGAVAERCFDEALREVFAKNDAWHIRIVEDENGPRQYFHLDPQPQLEVIDFSDDPSPRAAAQAWMEKDRRKPFRLDRGPLYRFALLRISPDRYCWYAIAHHLIIDGFGWLLFLKRVAAAYTTKLTHKPGEIAEDGSWRELLAEQLAYRGSDRFERDRLFWSSKFNDRPERVTLSGKPPRWPQTFLKATEWLPRTIDLNGFAQRHASSVTAVLVAATAIYLHRMTGACELLIGLPVHGRMGPKMRSIVGMSVNAITLRVLVAPQDSLADVIGLATRALREALRHQRYRYEDVRRDLGLGLRDGELAGMIVNYTPRDDDIRFGTAPVSENPLGNWWVEDFQIVFYGGKDPRGARLDAICNPANYDSEELDLHLRRFIGLLTQVVLEPPETAVGSLGSLSAQEYHQILNVWSSGPAIPLAAASVADLFESQVVLTPAALAVVHGEHQLTYAALDRAANTLAVDLIGSGIGVGDKVAITVPRSIDTVVAVLAVLKSGAAFVPIDTDYPEARIVTMLHDAQPSVFLATAQTEHLAVTGCRLIHVDWKKAARAQAGEATRPGYQRLHPLTADDPAYVIYTSGSTGQPKGVVGLHRGLVNRLMWMATTFPFEKAGPTLFKTSLAFIDGTTELLGPLVSGGTIVLAEPEAGRNPAAIVELVARYAIGRLTVVPNVLATILDVADAARLATCKLWITSGAALPRSLAQRFSELLPDARLLNLYGTSEASGDSLFSISSPDDVTIGRPIWNTRVYVLDTALNPVPIGVAGTLYLAGDGLAAGYHRRPDLTAEAFLHDPFGQPGSRMYRTGDLVRWRPNGTLEFLGRRDDQVKLNGVRIELGEIDAALRTMAGVRDAAVIASDDAPGRKRLVAFIVPDLSVAQPEKSAIRTDLARQLPDAFIPSSYVILPELPRLPNGKLDRLALTNSEIAHADGVREPAPLRTPTEFVIAEIWADILQRPVSDREDDYFELGGDSLRATILVARLRGIFGVELPLKTVFEIRTLHALAAHVDTLASDGRHEAIPAIERLTGAEPMPLSFSQRRMWLIQSLDPENTAYNMAGATRLIGPLDVAALSLAIDEVRRRHDILRTTYAMVDGDVVQQVHAWHSQPIDFIDLTQQSVDSETAMLCQVNAAAREPFDLAKAPMLNCALMRVGQDIHVLFTSIHHIAGDQWSFGLLGREISALYAAAKAGRAAELPSAPINYRDFAAWQHKFLQTPELRAQLQHWKDALRDVPFLELPTDHRRPPVQTLNGSNLHTRIPDALLDALERLGYRESTTLFMTLFAGFAALLHRLAGQTDIPIGVPIANRKHSAVELVVGTFVNTLVLRVDLSGDPTFSELLGRVRELALDAFANQDVPYDDLVQEIAQKRDASRGPLTQVLFNMLNAPMHGIEIEGVEWEPILIDRGGAQFDLSLSIERQITKSIVVEYNTDLFERSSVERLVQRYLRILQSVAAAPEKRLSQLEVLSDDERLRLLTTWNATTAPPPTQPFIRMFEAMAVARPDAPAVSFEGATYSYGDLNSRANALANRLVHLGAGRGTFIGIGLDRSLDLMVALLAVQKAGSAYVPLDPGLPALRLKFMIQDSRVAMLVSSSDVAGKLDLPEGVQCVYIDAAEPDCAHATADPGSGPAFSDAAYMIYTSGSTGVPKGVVISHGALANFLCSMLVEPGLGEADVVAAVTTISFDIAGLELYLPLLAGARIELIGPSTAGNGYALAEELRRCDATVMQATPATWQMLLDAGWQGGESFRALCGGEALSSELAERLLDRVGALWNLYGPTETTIWSTAGRVDRGDASISIGRPINNTQIYVLNGNNPAPIGVAGEICIGGAGVAIGYHERPELTDDRFISDPFTSRAGDRIYRTGDLGRWGADGRLYHLGRTDHQVKIRGYRIELGEIETVLNAHPAVRQAVVAAHRAGPADTRLVAHIVYHPGQELTTTELRRWARERLPEYMVPSIAVSLESLPLTPNGKLDRNGLVYEFDNASRLDAVVEPPAPGTETLVADIWKQLLKVDAIAADDNFFDLGGHSLLALRVVVEIETKTGARLDPRSLFFHSLRQFSAAVSDASGNNR
jgi:amino acid adenylation domain-containing protein